MHYKRIIALMCLAVLLLPVLFSSTAMASETQTGTIVNCTSAVNVRSGPGSGYSLLGTAAKGTVYPVYGETGSYYKIGYKGGYGYVYYQYLSVSSGTQTSSQTTASYQTGTIVNCKSGVNVRSGPGTKYALLGTAPKGAVYTVTGKSGSYYAINYSGRTGYVYYSYISVKTVTQPAPSPAPTPTPTPTQTAAPSPTPTPTQTAIPTPTPTATNAPTPTPTAAPSSSPTASSSPAPSPSATPGQQPVSGTVMNGYYASWAAYSGYTPLNIPGSELTEVTYAFANINANLDIEMGDPDIDPSNFAKLNQLKSEYPGLKTVISVGGWTWSGEFSDAALTDSSRSVFAGSVVAFIKQYGFDGVDIDWEYPGGGGLSTNTSRPADKTDFTLLMAELRQKLDAQGSLDGKHYILSFAGASGTFYANDTELSKLAGYVDYATIMTYDMHGAWPNSYTDFNAPLYTASGQSPQYKWSDNDAVRLWINNGFPASKIVMGIPFYGEKYAGVTGANSGLLQAFTSGGSISYDQIISGYLNNSAYKQFLDPEEMVPWLFNGSTFISYDDTKSIALKAAYIKQNNLGGATIWELSQNKDGTLLKSVFQNVK